MNTWSSLTVPPFQGFLLILGCKTPQRTHTSHRSFNQSNTMPYAHEPLYLSIRSPLHWEQPSAAYRPSKLHVPYRNRALNFWVLSPCALWSYISAVFFHFHPVWTASALSRMSMHSLVSLLLKLYGSWGAPSNYSPGAGAGEKRSS